MKQVFVFLFLIFAICPAATAQTFTFECVCDYVVPPDCDICNTQVQSRLLNGLLIRRSGAAFKWIEYPYLVRIQGNNAVIQELIFPNPETITINLSGTGFATMAEYMDSLQCNCGGGGVTYIAGPGIVISGDTISAVDTSATNEIQQIDTFAIFSGNQLCISLSADGVVKHCITLPSGSADTTIVTAGTGISVTGDGSPGSPYIITNTGDLSSTNEIQRLDTFTIVSGVLRASLLNDGVPFSSVTLPTADGSETQVNAGTAIGITGTGTTGSPYVVTNTADLSVIPGGTNALQIALNTSGQTPIFIKGMGQVTVTESATGDTVKIGGVGGIYGVSDTTQPAHALTIAANSTLTFQSQGDNFGGIVPFRVVSNGTEPDIQGWYANGDSLILSRSDTEFVLSTPSGLTVASGANLSLSGDSITLATIGAALSTEKTYLQITPGNVVKYTEGIPLAHLNQSGATTGQVVKWNGTAWVPDTDGGGGGGGADSTFAKSPSGVYTGKQITDNVYRTGKVGIGTTDTTAMLNLRAKSPAGTVLTTVQKISAPPRSAFSDPIFAGNSNFTASELDINPMKPNHFPSWNYGIWKEKFTIDSTTNLAVSQPGNAIRQWGFNLDNLEPKLARWFWNTEQLFYPGSGGSSAWEHYLELYDTLGRHERIFQLFGLHNGNIYEVDFAADDWHIRKPHTTNFALRIRPDVGLWHTDYPYSFRINNATRTGPLIERLHSGTYRNVLDWTTNGRLDVGDLGGIRLDNRLIIGGSSGLPKIISETTNLRIDSTELYIRTSGNRHLRMETYGSSDYFDLGFDNTQVFFRGSGSTIPMLFHKSAPNYALTINSTGRVGVGLSSAYSTIDIQQHTNGLDGSLRLVPVTGDYAGLFVNGDNELSFNRGGANRMFLTNAGQIRLATYTSTSSYPITPTGVLGFNSAGEIGTVNGITGTGSGVAGQIAVFDGTSSVTGYTSFTRSGSNIIVGASGGDHVEIIPGTSEISLFNAGTIDARIKADDAGRIATNVGIDVTGNSAITGNLDVSGNITTSSHFRAPGISSGGTGIGTTPSGTFNAFSPNGTSPYITFSEAGVANRGAFGFPASSGDFVWSVGNQVLSSGTERMRLTSGGNLGLGVTPTQKLDVNGTTKTVGFQMPTGATNLYILQSDASGNGSWVAPSTLGDNWGSQTVATTGTTLSGVGTVGSPLLVATDGIGPTELAPTSVTPGSYVTTNITVDAEGRITAAASGSVTYQTLRDDGVDKVQRNAINFVSTSTADAALTDDGANGETEVRITVPTGGIGATQLASTTVTAAAYGSATQVATFTVDADGRLTAAANAAITGLLSGLTATRIPFASGAAALTDDANLTWNNTTKRLSVGNTGGSPAASVHIAEGSVASWEPLRAAGTVSGNMITTLSNANNAGGASNNLVDLSVGGASAGDPAYRWLINGVDTWSMGVDNSDADKMKWKKASTPSTLSNVGLTMTADATPLIGINNDAPLHPLHVIGRATATVLQGISGTPTHTFGTGAGTSPSLGTLTGTTNGIDIQFTTGTAPSANANIVSITYPTAFSNTSFPVFCAANAQTATDITKFYISAVSATAFTIASNGTLSASTTYRFKLNISGR